MMFYFVKIQMVFFFNLNKIDDSVILIIINLINKNDSDRDNEI